ncbi:SDR family oxidoreductase [Pusillimonas noertemannii]|uniref:NAD(P)-dependent dehydrogenase (Short-subunit alcohol dehydrogenase family) n=1 Tax=Pusillimonas noertemannii TaxID=305977 RepID=A0A2U1CQ30_9BURK|nr:SDR family oxidoreductase [Pusillimonas noertemannii]NYT67315.1 SDR family oxidoreductase [Pusillimonas noertemannii]PVY67989.1 NAD(P)-dependent dehydrogenase (short-subunit alcohol dehydrogenase family) [Pusillimonas noertemannii]TFL12498.1 SDR family oxidoreductase [Pusillimonas noertemannii]
MTQGKHQDDRAQAEQTAEKQRRLQDEQDRRDSQKADASKKGQQEEAAQTGPREHPEPPMPGQKLEKPGDESQLDPRPQFMAPDYQGSEKLRGMSAIVTGGDSGIGRAVAVLFAREGANVSIIYLNEHEDARETCRHIEAEGRRAICIPGDVKNPTFCRDAVRQTVEAFGQLDILVNNAAFQEHAASLEDISDERFDETMRTNIYGYFYMARAALPHLKPGSSIINTGSVTGLRGQGELLDYSTTKGAIHAFTMSLASNLAKKEIRVNAVAPGPVWTPLNPADRQPEQLESFGKSAKLGRPAQPEELSPAYVFLAAPVCSSYITGIVLPVTGTPG